MSRAEYDFGKPWHVVVPTRDGTAVGLTERQVQALALTLAVGAREAAYLLGITETRVRQLTTRVYQKLGATSRWEAAYLLGWITLPPTAQAVLDGLPGVSASPGSPAFQGVS